MTMPTKKNKNKMNLLTEILRTNRTKHRLSITQLSLLLGCSRPQYERMERGENLFKPSQLTILATIYNDAPALYIDLQDVSVLLQKSGYDINPDRAKRLLIASLQYVTASGKDINNIVELLTEEPKSIDVLYQSRAEKLQEIIATQRQRLREIDTEIKSLATILTRPTAHSDEEITSIRRRLSALTEESTSRERVILRLLEL